MINPTLYCPIRGQLKIKAKSSDGLTFTEEKRRIDCIKFLLGKGYPKLNFKVETILLKFGNKGRNSFRTDIVVFSMPTAEAERLPIEQQREQMLIVAEIKRDNKGSELAKSTQVKPALAFLPDLRSFGIYWDDVEQKLFYREMVKTKTNTVEANITYLPDFGASLTISKLRFEDLQKQDNLTGLFRRIEDTLHHHCADKDVRYQTMLQLLLCKMYDEKAAKPKNAILQIQNFLLFDFSSSQVSDLFNTLLNKALSNFQPYLPHKVPSKFTISGEALCEVSALLAAANLLSSNATAIQEFYMFFAKQLYRWDLAQYFTPYEVVDFIVQLTNPQFGDTIKDPACGSADFLISAFRRLLPYDTKAGDKIWGTDNSQNAVQISVLNMLLNDDGKSNIKQEDSLEKVKRDEDKFSIILCNPPFGVKIQEKRNRVLKNFELGAKKTSEATGILFAELCVKQARSGGRIAIILPNGYLGNASKKYTDFRKWLLRHCKLVCVVGFPRFTFKKSGADVSASVVLLEKREEPLKNLEDTEDYPIYFNLLETVGWDISNKTAKKIFTRDSKTGAIILNEDNEPIQDADFDKVLSDLYKSPVVDAFPWIAEGIEGASADDGWAVSIKEILKTPEKTIDAKRFSRKYQTVLHRFKKIPHYTLLELCDVVPAGFKKIPSQTYKYVEMADVHEASYEYAEMKGWELPSRARHVAQAGDIFIGSIWGSVGKWFIAAKEAELGSLIVTNGFYRLKIKDKMRKFLPDLVVALSSEFYRVQMRALARGSDGLAEIGENDLKLVLIPKLTSTSKRDEIQTKIDAVFQGARELRNLAEDIVNSSFHGLTISPRKSHFTQV